jgi:hypothetical protein
MPVMVISVLKRKKCGILETQVPLRAHLVLGSPQINLRLPPPGLLIELITPA